MAVSSRWVQGILNQFASPVHMTRRFRYKKKWAVNKKPTGPCQLALANFDAFYKPVYGERWPLTRLSLLSLPKYCAVVNKYADPEKVQYRLASLGAEDFVVKAWKICRDRDNVLQTSDSVLHTSQSTNMEHDLSATEASESLLQDNISPENSTEEIDIDETARSLDPEVESMFDDVYKDNLEVFVPTVKVLSEKDQLLREEFSAGTFQPRDVEVKIQEPVHLGIPHDLRAFLYPSGNMSRFPPARAYNRRLGYYLMDAASVLPVLALNIQSTDIVLDLCSAPGGKAVIILQSLDLAAGGHLHCNDSSRGRVQRLKDVLSSYFPPDIVEEVEVTQVDGISPNPPVYNKVLVDVPCNADRHVVNDEDNNLFTPVRTKERLALMQLQTKLLISGIKSCVVGGDIVYSTCTLAPAQNDGVIQAAVEELRETSQIEVAVEDMSEFVSFFKDEFHFWNHSKFGQVIVPNLLQNSGPAFFAKLKRVK